MIRKLLTFFPFFCIYTGIAAQQNMTLYQMHDITQSNFLNPAVASDCKWNIGFPALGNISIAAGIPISYSDIAVKQQPNNIAFPEQSDTYLPYEQSGTYIDGDHILSQLKETNMLSTNISLNILTIGYRTDNMYFQFTMNEKASLRASFSKGPVELLLKGNAPYLGKTLTANVALSASEYREYGLSVAYGAGNDLWLGVRAKLLFGHAGAHSPKNTISLHTDSQTYALTLKSDILMMASYPGKYDEQTDLFTSEIDVSHFISNPINVGGAIDLGVTKVFENGLKLSASILNIGMINWGKNTHLLYKNAASLRYGGPTAGITQWKDLTDTLKSIVRLRYAEKGTFPQWLAPEIMAGVSYPVIDYMRVGITGYGGISSIGIPWAITATALTDNTSHVYGALSYTITGNSPVNVGAGFGVRLGAFNMHVITDNILAFFATSSQRYATVQFGINFKFGCGGEGGGNSKQYKSVPCPSFGHTPSSRLMSAVPCASGK